MFSVVTVFGVAAGSVPSGQPQQLPGDGSARVAVSAARNIERQLGVEGAGFYFDRSRGRMVVNITERSAAADVRESGAVPKVVENSDGSMVFVSGQSGQEGTGFADWGTVAYNADTGEEQWTKAYDGAASRTDVPRALILDPSGSTLVVTGNTFGDDSADWATVAYSAGTGDQLWSAGHNGTGSGLDIAWDLAITPDGAHTVVTGQSVDAVTSSDYATISYNTATSEEEWIGLYDGPASGPDVANAVAVGSMSAELGLGVFVTGESAIESTDGSFLSSDVATVAYREPWNAP